VSDTPSSDTVLSVRDLTVEYGLRRPVRAVRQVGFDLARGEVLGIAGESGCGKSTLAYAITRLLRPPARLTGGSITFTAPGEKPVDVMGLAGDALRAFRWRRIAMVFQSAMNSLNPVMTVRRQLADVFTTHEPGLSRSAVDERCAELLDLVGIERGRLSAYPHELSGGMRQRVTIAMALALRPDVIVMDEPTTALDVVVQRDILEEINRLRELFGFAVVFITHDLSLLLEISDRLAVMYAGRFVETGTAQEILHRPHHPYTVGLLRSFPSLRGGRQALKGIPGTPPDLARLSGGCPFTQRCPYAFEACHGVEPGLIPVIDPGLAVGTNSACLQYDPALHPGGPDDGLRRRIFGDSERMAAL
jgi:peptide/nickel transport system ATP-binding protein